jgi:hypothetical protein
VSSGGSLGGGAVALSPEAVTVAVLCRSDEPALTRTLDSLGRAAQRLAEGGRAVCFAICVNGSDGQSALAAARGFAVGQPRWATHLVVEAKADKARAWNLLRGSCTTPLLVFCDADVDVEETALVALIAALEAQPEKLLASARQVPALDGASLVARAAALPYRFDFNVVGGRLYAMRRDAVARMPEGLLLEDGWLSARLGTDRLLTVPEARVFFRPPQTLGDYLRERVRTEAGKVQIRRERRAAGQPQTPIARYPWKEIARGLPLRDWPLVALNLGVRAIARVAAERAERTGRTISWSTIATSKRVAARGEP